MRSARPAARPEHGGHDEKEQTLNQLLTELDGFDPRDGIVLLAATNRPEILDPALLRAGRFDRQVVVDRPDKSGRVAILKVHMKKVKAASDVDLEQIAAITPGFTGADLANLVNEAAIFATRRGAEKVSMEDFTSAVERIVAGTEKSSRVLNPHEREARRLSRDGPCAGGGLARGRRSGAQDLDHPALDRGARLHDAAADRGQVPHHHGRN